MANKQTLTYRVAESSEAAHLASLINAAFRSERTGQTWLYDDQAKRIDVVIPDHIQFFIVGPDTLMLTGTVPGEKLPIACCYLRTPSMPTLPHMSQGAAWMGLLAVQPEHQHKGYGLAMLQEAERHVREEWKVDRLEIDFVSSRKELGAWYERCGYSATGKKRDFHYGEKGREILADGLEMIVLGKDLSANDNHDSALVA